MLKQVSMVVNLAVLGSYIASWRPARATGNSCADGWSDPFWQNAEFTGPWMRAENQTRPLLSNIGLCGLVWLSQMGASPQ